MFEALKHNATRLIDFNGRETRAQFWPWAGCVFVVAFLGYGAVVGSMMAGTIGGMQAFAEANPDHATVVSTPGSYSVSIEGAHPELLPDVGLILTMVGALVAVLVVLLAAAVARRLHDRGRSAFWGLAPLPFIGFALFGMSVLFGQFESGGEPDIGLFFAIFFNNLIYLAVLATLVIQLAGAGKAEANRFGPPVA
jgi:uncharacterized membrane protein YhaH (DUF805 family)